MLCSITIIATCLSIRIVTVRVCLKAHSNESEQQPSDSSRDSFDGRRIGRVLLLASAATSKAKAFYVLRTFTFPSSALNLTEEHGSLPHIQLFQQYMNRIRLEHWTT